MRNSLNGPARVGTWLERTSLGLVVAVGSGAICLLSVVAPSEGLVLSPTQTFVALTGFMLAVALSVKWFGFALPALGTSLLAGVAAVTSLVVIAQGQDFDSLIHGLAGLALSLLVYATGKTLELKARVVLGLVALFVPAVGIGSAIIGRAFALDPIVAVALALASCAFLILEGDVRGEDGDATAELDYPAMDALQAAHVCVWARDLSTNTFRCKGNCGTMWVGAEPTTMDELLLLLVAEDRTKFLAECNRAVFEDKPIDIDLRLEPVDGKTRWLNARGSAQRNMVGTPKSISGLFIDVTSRRLQEERLAASESLHERLNESIPGVVYQMVRKADGSRSINYVSSNVFEIYGMTREQVYKNANFLLEAVHPEDRPGKEKKTLQSFNDQSILDWTGRIVRSDGAVRWVHLVSMPTKNENGDCRWDGIVLDVTDRHEAETALKLSDERFRAMSNASPLGMFMTDPEGSLIYANHKLAEIAGVEPSELLGNRLFDHIDPEDKDRVLNSYQASVGERSGLSLQCRLLRHDHETIWCSIKTAPVSDEGTLMGFVGLIEDVTDRYDLELESEQSRIAAERANQAKSVFLSRISHEVRTPLHAMLGFAQLLQMDDLDEGQRESVDNILASGNHLLSIIKDVLDIARAESGELGVTIAPVSLYPLLQESLSSLRPVAEERGISIDVKFDETDQVTVLADRLRLRQILVNVFSNAIKYNRREGAVVVSTETRADGYIELQIRDTGTGIPPDKVDRLFTPFDRLGAEGSGIEGTGLGLTLTKKLVEAMGGGLDIDSDERTGTSVTVTLRHIGSRQNGNALVEMRPPAVPFSGAEKSILLIEDNDSNIKLMEGVFQARPSYRLHIEKSGKSGLEYALQNRPDLVLLDMNLPDMVGLRLLERLKAELAETGVIVISATAEERQIERTHKHGAAAYLTKPLDVNELLRTVDLVLGAARK